MASCQQYETQKCGDSDQQRPQPLPQGQIVRDTCKPYDKADNKRTLGIDKDGNVALVICNPLDPTQTWLKIEDKKVNSLVPVFLLWNNFKVIACPDGPGQKVKLVVYNPFDDSERIRWSHAEIKDVLDFTPIFTAGDNNVENILNFDVDESARGDPPVVVQKPNVKQSQLWNISSVIDPPRDI